MLKKILLIVGGLAVAGGIAAALVIFQPWGLIGWDRTPGMGNTPGNIVNSGDIVQSGDWLYYIDTRMSTSIQKRPVAGGASITLTTDGSKLVHHLAVAGDWIYYNFGTAGIHKMRTDGTQQQQVCPDVADDISVVDGWIYYITMAGESYESSSYQVCRVRTNGTGRKVLKESTQLIKTLNVSDGWIYYIDFLSKRTLWKISTNGSGEKQIQQEKCSFFVVDGQWYYWKGEDGIYKTKTDGSEKVQLVDRKVVDLTVSDGWVYYRVKDDGLHKIRTDGTEDQKIFNGSCVTISIWGDRIYYRDPEGYALTSPLYSIKTDGTDWMQFSNG